MEAPTLENIKQTWLIIPQETTFPALLLFMKEKLVPIVRNLEKQKILDWYCFHIHPLGMNSKNPLSIHLKFLVNDINEAEKLLKQEKWEDPKPYLSGDIAGLNLFLLNGGEGKALSLMGKYSEWIIEYLAKL